jgi:hypothetical protein
MRQAKFPHFTRLPDYHPLELYTVVLRSSKLNRSGSKAYSFALHCGRDSTDEKLLQLRRPRVARGTGQRGQAAVARNRDRGQVPQLTGVA